MTHEWLRDFQGEGFLVEGDVVEVTFADGRRHRVRVEETSGEVLLSSVAVGAARAREAGANDVLVWRRNEGTRLTGFRFDSRGRIMGESFMPTAGLTPEEVRFRVFVVAEECDQLERALTGQDL